MRKNLTLVSLMLGVMLIASFGAVSAGTTIPPLSITDLSLNGEDQVTVSPSASITASIKTQTNNAWWKSTSYQIEGGSWVCVNTADHDGYGLNEHTESFGITAPSSLGTYDFSVKVYQYDNCQHTEGDAETLYNGIIVVAPCTVTVTLPGMPSNGWYKNPVAVHWTYSASCNLNPDQKVNLAKDGSRKYNLVYFGDTATRDYTWTPTHDAEEGTNYQLCIDTDLVSGPNVDGCSQKFNVDTTAPVIDSLSRTCNEGQTISLTAIENVHDYGSGVNSGTWRWDLDNDGTYGEAGETGATVSYKCKDGPSSETVKVKVSDVAGNEASPATVTMTVSNVAPTASIGGSGSLYEGSSITLLGSATDPSSDGDTPMTWKWDFNSDGTIDSTLQNPTLSCSQDGSFDVDLWATDSDGSESSKTEKTVTCENVAPKIDSLTATSPINEEGTSTLSAAVSDVGADDTTFDYSIDWGDGSADTTGSTTGAITATHPYMDDDADDKYTITLSVKDSDNAKTEKSVDVTVHNLPPWNVEAGANQNSAVGYSVSFTGSAEDVAADNVSYSWNFGDGNSGTGDNPSHSYAAKGTYIVTLTASDEDGGSATDTMTVTVYDYKVHLDAGWNLISIPLVPDNTGIDSVLATISGKVAYDGDNVATVLQYDAVKDKWYKARPDGDGGFTWASFISRLDKVIPGYGYYIKMAEEADLYLNGKPSYPVNGQDTSPVTGVPPSVTLAMDSWNLIGVYGTNNPSIYDALTSLRDNENHDYYDIIYNKQGNTVDTQSGNLVSKEGYWISVKKVFAGDETIEYKANYATTTV